MRRIDVLKKCRLFPALFILLDPHRQVMAQDGSNSITALRPNYSGTLANGSEAKDIPAVNENEDAKEQRWCFHLQSTEVVTGQPGFTSPYIGANSIKPDDNVRQTSSFDVYLGVRLWPGAEAYFNPEAYQGFGLSDTHGIAAFPNSEAYKVGKKIGDLFIAHLFLRQTFGFGGEQEELADDVLQVSERVDVSRLTLTIGRLSVGDQFDSNSYAHSGRTQFLNWVLNDNGAFDYSADSVGVIEVRLLS
jgi:high affinity Mn2+ porin